MLGSLRWPKAAGVFELDPGALRRPPVQLFPHHHSPHTDVGVLRLVDIAVMAGYAQVADLGKLPVLIQLRVVDQNMAAAQHIMQLLHLQSVLLQVGNDRRFLRAEPRRGPAAACGRRQPGP